MSSNLSTYFVVRYDHDDETFIVDNGMAEARFRHDTYDDDTGEWVYLDKEDGVAIDLLNLTAQLNKVIRVGQEK